MSAVVDRLTPLHTRAGHDIDERVPAGPECAAAHGEQAPGGDEQGAYHAGAGPDIDERVPAGPECAAAHGEQAPGGDEQGAYHAGMEDDSAKLEDMVKNKRKTACKRKPRKDGDNAQVEKDLKDPNICGSVPKQKSIKNSRRHKDDVTAGDSQNSKTEKKNEKRELSPSKSSEEDEQSSKKLKETSLQLIDKVMKIQLRIGNELLEVGETLSEVAEKHATLSRKLPDATLKQIQWNNQYLHSLDVLKQLEKQIKEEQNLN